jgi:hypothetical protein
MKKKIKISFLTGIVMLFCFATVYCQQRPSQRSFTSVMNEAKQKQAARNKMLQQIRQTTASNTISSSVSTQNQPVRGSIVVPATTQKTLSSPGTSQQPVNKQINSQPKALQQ